jgi:hypothetical protein
MAPTSSSVEKRDVKKFTECTKFTRDVTDRQSDREGEFTSEFIPDDDDQVPGFTNQFTIPIAPTVADSETRFTQCKPPVSRLTDDEVQDAIEAINEATARMNSEEDVTQSTVGLHGDPSVTKIDADCDSQFIPGDVRDFTGMGTAELTPPYVGPTISKPDPPEADQQKVTDVKKRSKTDDGKNDRFDGAIGFVSLLKRERVNLRMLKQIKWIK